MGVLHHIDLDEVFKQFMSHMSDDIGFSDLTRTVYQKDFL